MFKYETPILKPVPSPPCSSSFRLYFPIFEIYHIFIFLLLESSLPFRELPRKNPPLPMENGLILKDTVYQFNLVYRYSFRDGWQRVYFDISAKDEIKYEISKLHVKVDAILLCFFLNSPLAVEAHTFFPRQNPQAKITKPRIFRKPSFPNIILRYLMIYQL